MTFPLKKTKQKFSRYVCIVLPLIDQEFAIGIPLTEIHAQLNRESGFGNSFGTFANALAKARKEKRELIASTSLTPFASPAAQVPITAASDVLPASTPPPPRSEN